MTKFETILQKFGEKGEKTGWTYIEIPAHIAHEIKSDCKVSFRVKGTIDNHQNNPNCSLLPNFAV